MTLSGRVFLAASFVLIICCAITIYSSSRWLYWENVNGASDAPAQVLCDYHDELTSKNGLRATTLAATKHLDWPGAPLEALGNPLIKIGTSFVENSRELLLDHLEEFLEVYKNRPDKVNMCGIRINHAYALYISVKHLKPTTIIESGVNAGQSTYFMRAASPTAKIFPIDPLEKPICGQEKRWMDDVNSEYFTGKNFKDLGEIDWESRIASGEVDPDNTLVFLDDHLVVFDRFATLMKHGFRHVLLEDNYKAGEGATNHDKAGFTPKQMFSRVDPDSEFLFNSLITYAEFPPLVPPIMSKESSVPRKRAGGFMHHKDTNVDIVAPILRPDIEGTLVDQELYKNITTALDIDSRCRDSESYMQLMCYNQFTYMEVRPMAPRLASKLSS